eukprot:g28521.t1
MNILWLVSSFWLSSTVIRARSRRSVRARHDVMELRKISYRDNTTAVNALQVQGWSRARVRTVLGLLRGSSSCALEAILCGGKAGF